MLNEVNVKIKGILENLLDYMGLKNRYSYEVKDIPNMHPYMSAVIKLDREDIGIIGRVHPSLKKDDIYVFEISLNKLMKNIKPIKFLPLPVVPIPLILYPFIGFIISSTALIGFPLVQM